MSTAAPQRVRDAAGYGRDSHRWWVLVVVTIGTLMTILDSTVVNIALPKLMSVFATTINGAQWVLTSYLLALAIVIPLTGFLQETFGGKRVYIITLTLFTIASALCGVAWSMGVLIFFRVLQGLGGGLIQPIGMSMVLSEFPPKERGTALSLIGIPLMLGPALGPTLGGYLVQYVDWRLIFYINVPIGILGVIAASRILHGSETDRSKKLDPWGIALVAIGSAALLLGVDYGPTDGWGATNVVAEIAIGVVSLVAFVWVELSIDEPLLDLRLFRTPQFSIAVVVTLIIQIALFGAIFLLPLFLQNLRGLGAMQTGMMLIPQSLAVAIVMPISGRVFDRFGPTVVLVPGLILLTISTYMLGNLDLNTSNSFIIWDLVLRGVGMGLAMMPAMTCAMNAVSREAIPRATALTNALQRIAGSFGTAIMATVLTTRQTYQFAMAAQTVTPSSPGVQTVLANVRELAVAGHVPVAMAQQLGVLAIYQQVATTAAVRSFDDTFLFAAVVCIPSVLVALFVRNPPQRKGGPAMMLE